MSIKHLDLLYNNPYLNARIKIKGSEVTSIKKRQPDNLPLPADIGQFSSCGVSFGSIVYTHEQNGLLLLFMSANRLRALYTRPGGYCFSARPPGFSFSTIASFCIGIRQFLLLPNSTITVSSVISMITP